MEARIGGPHAAGRLGLGDFRRPKTSLCRNRTSAKTQSEACCIIGRRSQATLQRGSSATRSWVAGSPRRRPRRSWRYRRVRVDDGGALRRRGGAKRLDVFKRVRATDSHFMARAGRSRARASGTIRIRTRARRRAGDRAVRDGPQHFRGRGKPERQWAASPGSSPDWRMSRRLTLPSQQVRAGASTTASGPSFRGGPRPPHAEAFSRHYAAR